MAKKKKTKDTSVKAAPIPSVHSSNGVCAVSCASGLINGVVLTLKAVLEPGPATVGRFYRFSSSASGGVLVISRDQGYVAGTVVLVCNSEGTVRTCTTWIDKRIAIGQCELVGYGFESTDSITVSKGTIGIAKSVELDGAIPIGLVGMHVIEGMQLRHKTSCVSITKMSCPESIGLITRQTRISTRVCKPGTLLSPVQGVDVLHNALLHSSGVLVHGPPGTGKTRWVVELAYRMGKSVVSMSGSEVVQGKGDDSIERIWEEARQQDNVLVLLDEIDALCPNRDSSTELLYHRIVASVIGFLDECPHNTVVVGVTNRIEALDPGLRRAGRFDCEIMFGVPSQPERFGIFSCILGDVKHTLTQVEMEYFARITHGFVGADIKALVKEAQKHAFERNESSLQIDEGDMRIALKFVKPSALREFFVEVPKVSWEDVGGQNEVKELLKEAVEWPLKYRHVFERMKIRPPRGVLLFGPPGTGKTMLARAMATQSEMNFIAVKGPELLSKWVGESEKALKSVFTRARAASPTIVFFDELDALASSRGEGDSVGNRVLSQLLVEMDGVSTSANVVVVGATNRPDVLDAALLRPGRFDRLLYVGLPDEQARKEILKFHLKSIPNSLSEDVLCQVAAMSKDLSGAELQAVCREAAMLALELDETSESVPDSCFLRAASRVQPRTDESMMNIYRSMNPGLDI